MTTTVYKLPPRREAAHAWHVSLVAHLRSTSPEEAITRLAKVGVLAIPGLEPDSIILVGYSVEVRELLRFYREQSNDLERAHNGFRHARYDRFVSRLARKACSLSCQSAL